MRLQEIFDALSSGELSQISIGGGSMGEISEENYPKLLTHVNLGLTALYKRFDLKIGHMTVVPIQDREDYLLDSKFVIGNTKSREAFRYIEQDIYDPFKDDLLKVLKVSTVGGVDLPLNQEGNPYSVKTLTTTRLFIPKVLVNQGPELPEELRSPKFKIEFRANHPRLIVPLGYFDPKRVTVQLPHAYMEALLMFIASRVHAPIGMSGETQVGNVWFSRYEAECTRLEHEGLDIDLLGDNDRLQRGGWV